jgi:hypothetical protein
MGQAAFHRPSFQTDRCRCRWDVAPGGCRAFWRGGGERCPLGPCPQHEGAICAKPQGGDKRSHHIEAFR